MGSYLVSYLKKKNPNNKNNTTTKKAFFAAHSKKQIILQIVHNTLYILCRELLKIFVYCTVNKSVVSY